MTAITRKALDKHYNCLSWALVQHSGAVGYELNSTIQTVQSACTALSSLMAGNRPRKGAETMWELSERLVARAERIIDTHDQHVVDDSAVAHFVRQKKAQAKARGEVW